MAANFVTEEAFVYATFREFVKLWGNGSQAYRSSSSVSGGQAWVQLMSALGSPSSPHLFRHDNPRHGYHDNPCHGYHGPHPSQHRRRKGAKQRDRDRARAALHRESLLEAVAAPATTPAPETLHHDQPLLPPSPLHNCQEDQPEHHQRSPGQLQTTHPPPPSSSRDQKKEENLSSPAGWGYITENDSDICPLDPPPAQQSLSLSPASPLAHRQSLHQLIQALHETAAQPSPSVATPCKRRQYGSAAFCYKQTNDGMIRCEMTRKSKKQLARRGGHWDVVGKDVYLDIGQSDREENESDEDDDNLEELRDQLWNISFSMYSTMLR